MDQPFFVDESTSEIVRRGWVKTSSSIYKFWLLTFRGFQVAKTVQTPKSYTMGRLKYQKSWILKPKSQT